MYVFVGPNKLNSMNCGFVIRWIPIFVDDMGYGKPRIEMFNEIKIPVRFVNTLEIK